MGERKWDRLLFYVNLMDIDAFRKLDRRSWR